MWNAPSAPTIVAPAPWPDVTVPHYAAAYAPFHTVPGATTQCVLLYRAPPCPPPCMPPPCPRHVTIRYEYVTVVPPDRPHKESRPPPKRHTPRPPPREDRDSFAHKDDYKPHLPKNVHVDMGRRGRSKPRPPDCWRPHIPKVATPKRSSWLPPNRRDQAEAESSEEEAEQMRRRPSRRLPSPRSHARPPPPRPPPPPRMRSNCCCPPPCCCDCCDDGGPRLLLHDAVHRPRRARSRGRSSVHELAMVYSALGLSAY